MRMKPEHYQYLEQEIKGNLTVAKPLEDYLKAGMSARRWRWDLCYLIPGLNRWICNNLYQYLNDDHIDTALRQITGTK